ncbi:hypothetical protein ACU686_10230 [Yinghuangia aomiensis]
MPKANAAQRAAMTLLTNGGETPVLPLAPGLRLCTEAIDPVVAAEYGTLVDRPEDADVAVFALAHRSNPARACWSPFFHAGSLDFPDEQITRLLGLAIPSPPSSASTSTGPRSSRPWSTKRLRSSPTSAPTIERSWDAPSARPPRKAHSRSTCRAPWTRSSRSRPDVAFDTAAPLFRAGHGLRYTDTTG